MVYNYHTHTYLCNHAKGTPEEYVKRAIEGGIRYMGFSDHASFVFPDGYESGFRVPLSKLENYVSEISVLREKYRNQIDIKIGFEMEYYPAHFEQMLKIANDHGIEYLILGQHFLYEEHPLGKGSFNEHTDIQDLKHYIHCLSEGIKSGVYTYVAHPDVLGFSCDTDAYRNEMRTVCILSREYNVPLEINFLGIRDNRLYPNEMFWEIAGEEKSPVTFGFDAHDVSSAFDVQSLDKANELVKKYNLNYIGKPRLVLIQDILK